MTALESNKGARMFERSHMKDLVLETKMYISNWMLQTLPLNVNVGSRSSCILSDLNGNCIFHWSVLEALWRICASSSCILSIVLA